MKEQKCKQFMAIKGIFSLTKLTLPLTNGRVWWIAIMCLVQKTTGLPVVFK